MNKCDTLNACRGNALNIKMKNKLAWLVLSVIMKTMPMEREYYSFVDTAF